MGNPALTSKLRPNFVRPMPLLNNTMSRLQPANPGIISQMVGGFKKKPNLQKAQRMNPPEVPTRKLY